MKLFESPNEKVAYLQPSGTNAKKEKKLIDKGFMNYEVY